MHVDLFAIGDVARGLQVDLASVEGKHHVAVLLAILVVGEGAAAAVADGLAVAVDVDVVAVLPVEGRGERWRMCVFTARRAATSL